MQNNLHDDGDKKIVGKAFDGPVRFTVSAVAGLILFALGVVVSVYAGSKMPFGFFIGIPFAILGLLIPIFMNYDTLKEKGR